MLKKVMLFCAVAFLFFLCTSVLAQDDSLQRVTSEKLFIRGDTSWNYETCIKSPDKKQVACLVRVGNDEGVIYIGEKKVKGNDYFVVWKGTVGRHYDGISNIIFSSDSKDIAYIAQRKMPTSCDKYLVVLNDKELGEYDGVANLQFAQDNHLVYVVQIGNKWAVVMDGKKGKQYDYIGSFQVGGKYRLISEKWLPVPNSLQLVYEAQIGNKWTVVADGKEGKLYDEIIAVDGVTFSSDPSGFHYYARRGSKVFLVEEKIE